MKRKKTNTGTQFIITLLLCAIIIFTIGCGNNSRTKESTITDTKEEIQQKITFLEISLKNKKKQFLPGNELELLINTPDTVKLDSILIYIDDKRQKNISSNSKNCKITLAKNSVGEKKIIAHAFSKGEKSTSQINVEVLSDMIPKKFTYKVINTYPHDEMAYTQGLFIEGGELYESTGLEGGSTLRRVELKSGEVLQSYTIGDDYFCEGITLYKDKIYQLTWRSNVAFVYNKKDFSITNKLSYGTEGWGLCTVNDELIMSDGSNKLYALEPETFKVKRIIDVYDNEGPVSLLNELEYINGEIFANIYRTDEIVKIDHVTGKVLGYIDLSEILPENDRKPETDVLNGICFDKNKNRLFVTGKKWNKLFEIKVIPSK